jgi:hypothetical protein
MWSLPNIKAMNDRASASAADFDRQSRLRVPSKKHPCEHCSQPSTVHRKWFDIFSDEAKGVQHLCQRCCDQGCGEDGFFYCDGCERLMVENYTWEYYRHIDGDGVLCLNCYRKRELAKPENWIELTEANIAAVDVARIRCAPHLLAVGQSCPAELKFIDNAEFDSMDGHKISGAQVDDILRQAMQQGHKRAILILDSAWQFAVSIGIYVRRWPADKPFKGHLFSKAGDRRALPITFSKRYNTPRWAGIALDDGWEKGILRIEGNPLFQVPAPIKEAA